MKSIRLPMVGMQYTRCSVDHRVAMHFTDAEISYELVFGAQFTVIPSSGNVKVIDVSRDVDFALEVVKLLFLTVAEAVAHPNGRLYLRFEGNAEIQAEADNQYEAWEIASSNGYRVVCMPGGELAIWSMEI